MTLCTCIYCRGISTFASGLVEAFRVCASVFSVLTLYKLYDPLLQARVPVLLPAFPVVGNLTLRTQANFVVGIMRLMRF